MMTFCPCPQLNNNARGKINSFSTRVSGRYRIDVRITETVNRVNLIEQMQLAILYFRHLNIGGWGYIVRLLFVIIPSFHPQDQNEIIRIRSSLFTCTSIFLQPTSYLISFAAKNKSQKFLIYETFSPHIVCLNVVFLQLGFK